MNAFGTAEIIVRHDGFSCFLQPADARDHMMEIAT